MHRNYIHPSITLPKTELFGELKHSELYIHTYKYNFDNLPENTHTYLTDTFLLYLHTTSRQVRSKFPLSSSPRPLFPHFAPRSRKLDSCGVRSAEYGVGGRG